MLLSFLPVFLVFLAVLLPSPVPASARGRKRTQHGRCRAYNSAPPRYRSIHQLPALCAHPQPKPVNACKSSAHRPAATPSRASTPSPSPASRRCRWRCRCRSPAACPAFLVVGLPDKAVGEARERVRAALSAMGLSLPPRRILINLQPADLLKEGSHFDLPIALGVLAAMDVLPREEIAGYAALGELSLDGTLNPVAGVLPAAIGASARDLGLICPAAQGGEAAWAGRIEVLAARRPAVADQPFPRHPGADPARSRRCGRSRPRARTWPT